MLGCPVNDDELKMAMVFLDVRGQGYLTLDDLLNALKAFKQYQSMDAGADNTGAKRIAPYQPKRLTTALLTPLRLLTNTGRRATQLQQQGTTNTSEASNSSSHLTTGEARGPGAAAAAAAPSREELLHLTNPELERLLSGLGLGLGQQGANSGEEAEGEHEECAEQESISMDALLERLEGDGMETKEKELAKRVSEALKKLQAMWACQKRRSVEKKSPAIPQNVGVNEEQVEKVLKFFDPKGEGVNLDDVRSVFREVRHVTASLGMSDKAMKGIVSIARFMSEWQQTPHDVIHDITHNVSRGEARKKTKKSNRKKMRASR
ncbi:unnamed protein product [Chrysoparadoxa australica]